MIKLAPSILSADFANLGRDVTRVLRAGADMIHVDVMDGHFVPNLSIGVPVVASLRAATDGFLDVHLMIADPGRYIVDFAHAGADLINMHVESNGDIRHLLHKIKQLGRKCALTIKPATPPIALFPYLDLLDMAVVMSVEPGFGGQKFMPEALKKLSALRGELTRRGLTCDLQVDGGVTLSNAADCVRAGANVLVAGSAVFGADDPDAAVRAFKAVGAPKKAE